MVSNSQLRDDLRPHGITSPACRDCYFFHECGGFQSARSLSTCFDETCCEYTGKDKSTCNSVCPFKPDFSEWLNEVSRFGSKALGGFSQTDINLPYYVPLIEHRYSRTGILDWPIVALDTYDVVRLSGPSRKEYKAVATNPAELRQKFRIDQRTKVILRGVAKDGPLELWWQNRLVGDAPFQLSKLGISAAVSPNFSHFLGVPRTDNIFNRQRQLICMRELADAGLNALPHLSAVLPGDWGFWEKFLANNSMIKYVAKEFQTGNRNRAEGMKSLTQLERIQNSIGRPLHPIVIGGAQLVEEFARRFERFTLIDSRPFTNAWLRHEFDSMVGKQPWYPRLLLKGQPIDELLLQNLVGYSQWIEARIHSAR